MKEPVVLENNGEYGCKRLDQHELQDSLLYAAEEDSIYSKLNHDSYLSVWRGFSPSKGHGYFIRLYLILNVLYRTYFEFKVNNKAVFPAQEMYQQLHKDVENICFITR